MIFTDRCGLTIGNVKIPGVDPSDANHIKIPGMDASDIDVVNIEIPGVDVYIQDQQVIEIIDPDIPPTDPAPIKPATVYQKDAALELMPAIQQLEPKLLRSSRVRTQTDNYTLSMSGSKYSYAVMQLEIQGVLNQDAHMFVQKKFYQSETNVVASLMKQLSLKSGLREWGDKDYTAGKSEMKLLYFRNTFKPKHWRELTHTQPHAVLESHMFLKEKKDEAIKGRAVAGGNNQRD